jgi:DNA mismatch repair protein MutL
MPIRVLDPEVAQKIAAGEVVERPASAVKELVENALDAGARGVQIEIRSGGLGLIRVSDDGSGIPAAEVELAFVRHATSKLSRADDLAAIQTLGFRGEALASIAAVSQVVLYTRHRDEELGVALTLEAGQVVERKPWAGAAGTTIHVRNLFFNVPARLKFLRSATGEAGQIGHLVESFALGHPEVRFRLINDGRRAIETPGTGDLRDALRQVYGSAVADGMLLIDATAEATRLRVWGLIGLPDQNRATRSALTFFVNGRRVSNASLGYAVEEAYRPALPLGRHPIVALHLELPASEVDCNVHPAKTEVRLVNERTITSAVHHAVRAAILEVAPVPEVSQPMAPTAWPTAGEWFGATLATPTSASPSLGRRSVDVPLQPSVSSQQSVASAATLAAMSGGNGSGIEQGLVESIDPASLASASTSAPPVPDVAPTGEIPFRPTLLRPVGQVQNTYVVAEGPNGVYFIDQHTAHERVLYEEILARRSGPTPPAQALLTPFVVQLNARQRAALIERGEALTQLGFSFEEFGPDSFALRAVPTQLARADLARTLRDAADALAGDPVGPDGADRLAATLACHSAVRAGDPLTPEEISFLLARLEQTDVNRYCPHGRPIVIHLPVAQLERDFHRR